MEGATFMTVSPACASSVCFSRSRYPGKERDSESGNDYFEARYYASSMGRFLSPDPKAASGHPVDPQTWNRYVYSGNNPLKFIDPDGKEKQLVVYVNQPVPGTRAVKEGLMNYGHAFIGVKDTVSGVEHRIGFYLKSQGDLAGGGGKIEPTLCQAHSRMTTRAPGRSR